MHRIELTALDGREPLGFLAALGVVRLLAEETVADVRLHFSDRTATAVLTGPYRDIDAVVGALTQIAAGGDALIPGATPGFPQKAGKGADPMRVSRRLFPELCGTIRTSAESRWLSVLLTDLAVDSQDRVALTPYSAPSGKMNLRTFFEKPVAAVRAEPSRLREALTGWRRVDGVTGEYFDHRVLRSSADHPLGVSSEAGVPGATWLAIMALPMLRLTGDGRSVSATLWHRLGGRRASIMVWPLWRRALDVRAIEVLLEHPALRPRVSEGGVITVGRANVLSALDALTALDVFRVCGAERQRVQGRNFAGVLAPVHVSRLGTST
jgi:CRISPR-associated endonuclease/helicase Cas3